MTYRPSLKRVLMVPLPCQLWQAEVVILPASEEAPPPAEPEVAEAVAEVAAEISSDQVEIARIAAEADVQRALIEGEARENADDNAREVALAEIDSRQGNEEWREEMTSLRELVTSLSATVATLSEGMSLLTLPPSETAAVPMIPSTIPTDIPLTDERQTEPSASESREEVAEEVARVQRRIRRMI